MHKKNKEQLKRLYILLAIEKKKESTKNKKCACVCQKLLKNLNHQETKKQKRLSPWIPRIKKLYDLKLLTYNLLIIYFDDHAIYIFLGNKGLHITV